MADGSNRYASPLLGGQIVILGGQPAFGRDESLNRPDCCGAIRSFYHQAVARHGLWAAVRHYEQGLVQHHDAERRMNAEREQMFPNDRRAGSCTRYIPISRFSQVLAHRTFGTDRMGAILSGISPGTRPRYLSAWRHWVGFMRGKGENPWIARSSFNWGDDLIDFMLCEAKMMGNDAPTIAGEISAVRFWRIISGYPDCPLGGGAIPTSAEKFEENTRLSENTHRLSKSLTGNWIRSEFWEAGASPGARTEPFCAVIMGFFSYFALSSWDV